MRKLLGAILLAQPKAVDVKLFHAFGVSGFTSSGILGGSGSEKGMPGLGGGGGGDGIRFVTVVVERFVSVDLDDGCGEACQEGGGPKTLNASANGDNTCRCRTRRRV